MSEGWNPIETAPRDGTRVLVYVPPKWVPAERRRGSRKTQERFISAFWSAEPGDGNGWILSDYAKELIAKHGGFWAGDPQGRRPITSTPSHWMPLPAPPSE